MKRIILILLLTVVTSVNAQSYIPGWFLNPPTGEYVGVSAPTSSRESQYDMAIVTALMSYYATSSVRVSDLEDMFSDQFYYSSNDDITTMTSEAIVQSSLSYHVCREYYDDSNICFISIKVDSGGSNKFSIFESCSDSNGEFAMSTLYSYNSEDDERSITYRAQEQSSVYSISFDCGDYTFMVSGDEIEQTNIDADYSLDYYDFTFNCPYSLGFSYFEACMRLIDMRKYYCVNKLLDATSNIQSIALPRYDISKIGDNKFKVQFSK